MSISDRISTQSFDLDTIPVSEIIRFGDATNKNRSTESLRQRDVFTEVEGLSILIGEIARLLESRSDSSGEYALHGWVNILDNGRTLGWHEHLMSSFHGFLCIDCGVSSTIYKDASGEILDIPSIDGNLVLSLSAGMPHKTTHRSDGSARITLAYNLIRADDNATNGEVRYKELSILWDRLIRISI